MADRKSLESLNIRDYVFELKEICTIGYLVRSVTAERDPIRC